MNLHYLFGYPLFFIAALEIALSIILLRQNPRNSSVNKSVASFSFFTAVYVLSNGISYILEARHLDFNFFNRFAWIGWFSIPAALQFIYFLKDEKSRLARRIGYILYSFWGLIFVLTLTTNLVEPGDASLIPYINRAGPLENPARLIGMGMIIWIMVEIYRLRRRVSGIKKAQLNYFFHGTAIFAGGGALLVGLLPLFNKLDPALGSYFSFPWVVLTFYAITRHRLFDIRLVISRALTVTVLAFTIALSHVALFKLFEPALGSTFAIVLSVFLIGFLFFGTPLSRRLQRGIQHLIIKDAYSYQRILKESSKAIITILDLDELLHYLINCTTSGLGVENACLFLKEKEGVFALRHGYGLREEAEQGNQMPPAVIARLRQAAQVVVREELEDMFPARELTEVSAYLQKIGAELLLPLIYKGQVRGVLTLGFKGNGEPYVDSDIELLEALAGHAAIAIENAWLYDEARRTQESLSASESKFRTLADTAAIAIFIHQGGKFLYANPAAEYIGGYTVSEYLNLDFPSLTHPDYLDLIKSRARERLDGGQAPPQYEFKIIRKNKEERWVLMTAGVTVYNGKPAVIGTLIDITARKKAEEEKERLIKALEKATNSLRESEAKFRTLAETTTAAIFIHQGQKLVYANRAGEIMSGYSREELLREDFWAMIHPDYQELTKLRGQARMRGETVPPEYEFKFVRKDGEECWASTTAGVIEFGGKPAVIATLVDITNWKRAEEAKLRFYEESVRLYQERIEEEKRHRMEKEKILMDLHDGIGGITTNISILSELAQKAKDGDAVKRTLATISRLSRDGIAEIRSFMHSLDHKDLNWRTLAVELRNQGMTMVEHHSIQFLIDTAVEDTQEQPGSLVWVNLFKIYKETLTNVIKHSKATTVKVLFRVGPEGVRLVIEDDGVGIGAGRAGGRGLSHMKTRAAEIGGSVNIVSDRGTTMKLELPLPLKYPIEGMVKK